MAPQPERQRLVVQQNTTAQRTISSPSYAPVQEDNASQQQRLQQDMKMRQRQRYQQEILAMEVLKQQRIQQQEALKSSMQKLAEQNMLLTKIKRIQVILRNRSF